MCVCVWGGGGGGGGGGVGESGVGGVRHNHCLLVFFSLEPALLLSLG